MIKIISLAGSMVLFLSGASFAAHPLITDDTGTQGQGKFLLEVNGEHARDNEDGVKTRETELAAILSYGAVDNLDLVIGVPYLWQRAEENGGTLARENGLSDISAEVKWRFLTFEKFSLGLKPGLSLPTGDEDKGLGSGKVTEKLFLISTLEAEPLAIHTNVGYIHYPNDFGEREDLWHASIAAEYRAGEKVTLVGNTGVERSPDPDTDTLPAFILGGLIYGLSENFKIDFGVKAGLNGSETDLAILAGSAWNF